MRTRQENSDETTRLAVELYARDQELLHHRLATEAAMEEVAVPVEYLRKAEVEIQKKEALKKRKFQLAGIMGACLVPPIVAMAILITRAPSTPIAESFASTPEARWTLDSNPGTQAKVQFDDGKATITVDRFAPGPDGYWATLRSFDGNKSLRTLSTLTFRARGTGLSHVRFRFVNGKRSWVTAPVNVGSDWKTYPIPLDRLNQFRKKGDEETSNGAYDDRVGSSVTEIQIQTGNHVNPVDAHGTIEVDDVTIK